MRRVSKIRDAPNACPFCGWEPILCPACGHENTFCLKCGKLAITCELEKNYRGIQEQGLLGSGITGDLYPPILEGEKYDGSDFIYPHFITKHALNWLLEQKVTPFFARPVEVDVSRCTASQMEVLESAKGDA